IMWHPDDFVFVPGQTPLTSLKFLVFISILHFIITYLLEIYMSKRTEPINVRRIQRCNNIIIGIYSALTFILINIIAYRDN
ncbi:unnamed protein product, partial [Rotaria sp. Silwood2]